LATSVDAGATWTVLKDLPRKRSFALGLPAITALAGNHLYLVDDYLLYDLKFGDGDWENPKAFGLNGSINSLWADPQEPDVVVAATLEGLFWSADAGLNFQRADLNLGSAGTSVVSVLESGPGALLVGVSDAASPQIAGGLIPQKWYLVGDRIPRPTWKRRWQSSRDWVVENHTQWWFYPFVSIGLFLLTYLLGCIGLVLIATRHGSYVFARSWITEFASAPLRKLPSIGSWALFLGYATRLARLPAVAKAANQYFGLPAVLGDGTPLLPDDDGKTLHESIAGLSAAQRPVYLSGSGGAGKSTLFARLCWLLVTKRAPTAWRGFRPILVPAISYEKSPLQAITTTLRDRDGVAVDEDIVRAQLQTGRFVVMFDGMSELPTADTAIGEVIRFCRSADYRNCRFLLAGRSMAEATDLPVVELQPMNSKAISDLLEKSGLGEVRKERIKRQLSAFESSAIVPLLWSMAVEESRDGNVSQSRAQLYERYFRRLLNVQGAQFDLQWAGWRSLFEQMARWFFLASSSRGQGLPHGALVDRLTAAGAPKDTESPVAAVIRRYPMPFKSALELLESADEAGILEGGRRWRFAHDTYEEFFAACWITACVEEQQPIEISANWYVSPDKRQELAELRKFCADMGSATALREYEEKIPMPDA
jgi:hypothetical protein